MAQTEVLFTGLISSTVSSDSITTPILDSRGNPGALNLARYRELAVFINFKTLTGGSSPSLQVVIQSGDGQSGVNQQWNNLLNPPTAWTTAPQFEFTTIGPGLENNHSLGFIGRILYLVTGSPSACTFYVTIIGKL